MNDDKPELKTRCGWCDKPRPDNTSEYDSSQLNKPVKGWRYLMDSFDRGYKWKCPECQVRDEWIWMCLRLMVVINSRGGTDTPEFRDADAAIQAYGGKPFFSKENP